MLEDEIFETLYQVFLVRDIMTSPVIYTAPDESIEQCMALMTERRIRHLPVLVDERLIGIVSIGDLVKSIISDQKNLIQDLENFILQHSSITGDPDASP